MKTLLKKTGIVLLLALFVFSGAQYYFGALGAEAEVTGLERINIIPDVIQAGNGYSYGGDVSQDGNLVAFISSATNLVEQDTDEIDNVFVINRATGEIELVSVGDDESIADGPSDEAVISADGRYVAFVSSATNLIPGDSNFAKDVFVRDRELGTTERVSVPYAGEVDIDADSYHVAISADGRYVAFVSDGNNVLISDADGAPDVFVYDRQTDTTEIVSVKSDESGVGGISGTPSVSADGRYVTFQSSASTIVLGDVNDDLDIFIRDRQLGTTSRVSEDSDETGGDRGSYDGVITPDARYVAFLSESTNLVDDDTNNLDDAFVRDLQTGTTERVSVTSLENESDGIAFEIDISDDGRYVIFISDAVGLVAGDTNTATDVFVRDRQAGTTERVSVNSDEQELDESSNDIAISPDGELILFTTESTNLGEIIMPEDGAVVVRDWEAGSTAALVQIDIVVEGDGFSRDPVISADNNVVAFESCAGNLVNDDDNNYCDVFVFDRTAGEIERVSVSSSEEEGDGDSSSPAISADGRYVAFESAATNLDPDTLTADEPSIFVRDRQLGTTELVSDESFERGLESHDPAISADGRYVAFESTAPLAAEDGGNTDVYVRDRQSDTFEWISVNSQETSANGDSGNPTISGDGRFVTFESEATNLDPKDSFDDVNVYLRDRQNGTTTAIALADGVSHGNNETQVPVISADGNYAAFASASTDLVEGDTNGVTDIFILDRASGDIERVSVSGAGVQANGASSSPAISADGRYVTFVSVASNLDTDASPAISDVFVHDRQTGDTDLVSLASDGTQNDQIVESPAISADGRYVTFVSCSAVLVPNDTNGFCDVFLRDRQANTTERISVDSDEEEVGGSSGESGISDDGRYVAFESCAADLIAGDTNGVCDIFIRDRQSGTTERVSVSSSETEGDYEAGDPSVSADGRYVVFYSQATNLVAGDANNEPDIFIRDRQSSTTERVSVSSQGVEANGSSEHPSMSSDARFVVFVSRASTLVPQDTTGGINHAFIHDRQNGTTELVSVSDDGEVADNNSSVPTVSSNGRLVAFESSATNLNGNDPNAGGTDTFIRDRGEETTDFLVNLEGGGIRFGSSSASMSADGTAVSFYSNNAIVSNDNNGEGDIYLYTVDSGAIELISVDSDGVAGDERSGAESSVSEDGRYVAFYTRATSFDPEDTNEVTDIYLRDRTLDTIERVSVAPDGGQATENDMSDEPDGFMLSADASYLVFGANESTLLSGDTNEETDIYLATLEHEQPRQGRKSGSVPSTYKPVVPQLPGQPIVPVSPNDTPGPAKCIPEHFDTYLRRGDIGVKVSKVQQFLKDRGFYTGRVTGYFGPITEAAVKKFQLQYAAQVLAPWGLTEPTGYWYQTTRAMANKFVDCKEGKITLPNGVQAIFE